MQKDDQPVKDFPCTAEQKAKQNVSELVAIQKSQFAIFQHLVCTK